MTPLLPMLVLLPPVLSGSALPAMTVPSPVEGLARAIGLATLSFLLVAAGVAALFLGTLMPFNLTPVVASLFVMAMAALMGAVILLRLEVRLGRRLLEFEELRRRPRPQDHQAWQRPLSQRAARAWQSCSKPGRPVKRRRALAQRP